MIRLETIRLPVLPIAYMLAIFALSSVPGIPTEDASAPQRIMEWLPPQLQNLLHLPLFAGLAVVWQRYLRWSCGPRSAAVIAFLMAVGYGVVDEFHQSFVPGRYGSLTDIVSNTIGAAAGVVIAARRGVSLARGRAGSPAQSDAAAEVAGGKRRS